MSESARGSSSRPRSASSSARGSSSRPRSASSCASGSSSRPRSASSSASGSSSRPRSASSSARGSSSRLCCNSASLVSWEYAGEAMKKKARLNRIDNNKTGKSCFPVKWVGDATSGEPVCEYSVCAEQRFRRYIFEFRIV